MNNLNDFDFDRIFKAISYSLEHSVKPFISNDYAKEELDRACLLIHRIGELIDDSAEILNCENKQLLALIAKIDECSIEDVKQSYRIPETTDIKVSSLYEKNQMLRTILDNRIVSAFSDMSPDEINLSIRDFICQSVRRRNPPEYIRGL